MKKRYRRVLTIAGSDSSGGAGIQADLKTFSALGCFGMTAITAITVQNTCGVSSIFPLPPNLVKEQIEAVISDIGVDAIKIGMLFDPPKMDLPNVPIVLDPVMKAKGGAGLLKTECLDALKALFPKVLLITPNLEEASALIEQQIHNREEMIEAGRILVAFGANNVLIKGGDKGCDCLITSCEEVFWFEKPRVKTLNTHGTGCTYSSAIASYLAHGFPLKEAVNQAKQYLHEALEKGSEYQLGSGHGPLYHFTGVNP
jgi:hydroxymethylpyrimidine/phosphomethylpyrimidine kinase